MHDLRWPGRQRANLDHVAVGPTGIWVIDAKNWSGEVTVRDGVLRCSGWRKQKETESAASAASSVAALLQPSHQQLVRPFLSLAGTGAELTEQATPSGTWVVGLDALADSMTVSPVRLQQAEVTTIAGLLATQLGGTEPASVTGVHIPAQAAPGVRSRRTASRERTRAPRRPSPAPAPTSSRRQAQPPAKALLFTLLKVALFLAIALAALQTMPLWIPLFQQVITDVFLQPMLDTIAEPTAPTEPMP